MSIICLHDRNQIESLLRRDLPLHLYEIGDLDDFFWEYTTWYALREDGGLRAAALVYTGTSLPVLLALSNETGGALPALLEGLRPFLPPRFYAHLSPGLESIFARGCAVQPHGTYDKMVLAHPQRLAGVDTMVGTTAAVRLGPSDLTALQALYAESYPGNWFDPRMLETGYYFGVRRGEALLSAAGVHVYSPRYRIGVLGNITTHPAERGRGLGTLVTAALCKTLLETVDTVGLNVNAGNAAAIACYRKLGFERAAGYGEFMITHQGD